MLTVKLRLEQFSHATCFEDVLDTKKNPLNINHKPLIEIVGVQRLYSWMLRKMPLENRPKLAIREPRGIPSGASYIHHRDWAYVWVTNCGNLDWCPWVNKEKVWNIKRWTFVCEDQRPSRSTRRPSIESQRIRSYSPHQRHSWWSTENCRRSVCWSAQTSSPFLVTRAADQASSTQTMLSWNLLSQWRLSDSKCELAVAQ